MKKLSKAFFEQAAIGAAALRKRAKEIDKASASLDELEENLLREKARVRKPLLNFLASAFSAVVLRDLQETLREVNREKLKWERSEWTVFEDRHGDHFERMWRSSGNQRVCKACDELPIGEETVFYAALDYLQRHGFVKSCAVSEVFPREKGDYSVWRLVKKRSKR